MEVTLDISARLLSLASSASRHWLELRPPSHSGKAASADHSTFLPFHWQWLYRWIVNRIATLLLPFKLERLSLLHGPFSGPKNFGCELSV